MCKDSWGVIVAESTGLLDFLNTPAGMGLLSAVGSGLAGARRGGTMNAVGSGLLGGVQGYAQGQELQRQSEYATQRGKLFDMQAQQLEQQQAAQRAEAERQAARQGYLGSVGQVTSPRLDAQPNKFDPMQFVRLGGSIDEAQKLAGMGDWGRAEVARTLESQDAQGNKITLQFDKFGRPVGDGVQGYTAPVQVDLGGRVQFVKPQAGVNLTKTMTPGEIAANARAREAAARDALSVTYQQDAEGNFVALPTKVQPGSMVRGLPVVSGPGMSPLKGASKLGEGQKKQISGIESLSNAVDAYTSAIDQWDNKKFLSPNERAKMGTLYNNMMLQAKEAYNLGVLNGPDYDILQSVIKDPTTPGALLVSNETLKGQATTLRDMLQNNVSSIRSPGNQMPQARPAPGGASGPKFLGFE